VQELQKEKKVSDYPIFEEGTERSFTTGRTAAEQEAWVDSQESEEETTVRRFELHRQTDVSGISGTGIVADGVVWEDGSATIRWRGDRPSIVHWQDIAHAESVHGHGGFTEFVFLDA
jgi:hypothetical protein